MKKADFALSYYAVLSQQDWTNLTISRCRRVLLSYGLARSQPGMLARLTGLGCRAVIRIEQDNHDSPFRIGQELQHMAIAIPVDAVIVGVEPDEGVDFRYGAADWGQSKAYASAQRASSLIDSVHGVPLQAVAPAMTWPPAMISEDGELQPGRTTWREIVAPHYQRADGIASHCGYVLGWDGHVVNEVRFKNGLKREAESWHKPLWVDECTLPTSDDMLQMQCAIDLARIIMRSPSNDRVKLLSPFCSAGTAGLYWSDKYLIKNPLAYELLASWLSS